MLQKHYKILWIKKGPKKCLHVTRSEPKRKLAHKECHVWKLKHFGHVHCGGGVERTVTDDLVPEKQTGLIKCMSGLLRYRLKGRGLVWTFSISIPFWSLGIHTYYQSLLSRLLFWQHLNIRKSAHIITLKVCIQVGSVHPLKVCIQEGRVEPLKVCSQGGRVKPLEVFIQEEKV